MENAAVHCLTCGFVLADDGQLDAWHTRKDVQVIPNDPVCRRLKNAASSHREKF